MLIALYWFLVVVFGGFVIVTFMLGELADIGESALDGVTDTIGGLFEGIGHAFGGLLGAADAADAGLDIADVAGADFDVDVGVSPFNFRSIIMFAAGFGAGGLVGSGMGLTEVQTLIPAFGFGLVGGAVTWIFVRFLYGEQASTTIHPTDYVGLIGHVIIPIRRNALGQVALEVKMLKKNLPARSEDGTSIVAQTSVTVVSMEGGVLVVRKHQ